MYMVAYWYNKQMLKYFVYFICLLSYSERKICHETNPLHMNIALKQYTQHLVLSTKYVLTSILMGAIAEAMRLDGHGWVPTSGVPTRGVPYMRSSCQYQFLAIIVDSLQLYATGGLYLGLLQAGQIPSNLLTG